MIHKIIFTIASN